MATTGIKECVELLDGVKVLGVAAKKVMADGKISFADIGVIMNLMNDFAVLNAALKGVGEIPAEVKDVSMEEAQILIAKVLEVTAAIKAA